MELEERNLEYANHSLDLRLRLVKHQRDESHFVVLPLQLAVAHRLEPIQVITGCDLHGSRRLRIERLPGAPHRLDVVPAGDRSVPFIAENIHLEDGLSENVLGTRNRLLLLLLLLKLSKRLLLSETTEAGIRSIETPERGSS